MLEKLKKLVAECGVFSIEDSKLKDGRLESAISEESVKDLIKYQAEKNGYKVIMPKPRHWYDIALVIDNNFVPINIKITSGSGADNISSKKSMMYFLTGINNDETKISDQWNVFNTLLFKNIKDTNSDYYFIVVFKDKRDTLVTTFSRIDGLVPNGNNLPFQYDWSTYKETKRSRSEQIDYILKVYYESWKKRAEGFLILKDLMEDKYK